MATQNSSFIGGGIAVENLVGFKKMSQDEVHGEMKDKLQKILNREFAAIPAKRVIKEDKNGLTFACPYCGDSATHMSKKRAHLTLYGNNFVGYFKCYNCNKFVKISQFFKDHHEPLSIGSTKYVADNQTQITGFNHGTSQGSSVITADIFSKELIKKYAVPREELKRLFGLLEITTAYPASIGYEYLIGRLQMNFKNFLYDPKGQNVVILNLVDDLVIGFQSRYIGKKKKAVENKGMKYHTWTLEEIHSKIFKDEIDVPANINSLSTLFGLYNINVYKPVIVTEGPFDSFLLPNCIALSGAGKSSPVELPYWYVFDSDKTGDMHAVDMLKKGNKVFLWGKFKNDFGLPKQDKWDINDALLYIHRKNGYFPQIDWFSYFSDNVLDMRHLIDFRL